MSNASIYGTLSRKMSFVFFHLLHSPVDVCHITLQQQAANVYGLHCPLHLLSFWEISGWNLSSCSSDTASIAQKNIFNILIFIVFRRRFFYTCYPFAHARLIAPIFYVRSQIHTVLTPLLLQCCDSYILCVAYAVLV